MNGMPRQMRVYDEKARKVRCPKAFKRGGRESANPSRLVTSYSALPS